MVMKIRKTKEECIYERIYVRAKQSDTRFISLYLQKPRERMCVYVCVCEREREKKKEHTH